MANPKSHVPVPATIPEEFPEILRDLNRSILREQPDDIVSFCAAYFTKKITERSSQDAKGNNYQKINENYKLGNSQASLHSNSDDDDEEYVPPMPAIETNHNRGRRTSVSAESMAPSTEDYVKVIIPKSQEQRSRIEKAIKGNFLFKSIDEEQFADVVNAMVEKKVLKGETIITQGGIGDYFYCVETGTLDVFVSRNGSEPVKVTDYGPNGSFGELALMYNAPRAATVIATQDCILWALDRVTFRRILMENTSRKRRMYESFLEEMPLLTSLEPYERHKIADALETATFSAGEIVIKQGDPGDCFYMIEAGEAQISQKDEMGVEHQMNKLKKGDYFGGIN
jgi:CRP-like cAMP-binding protein